MDTNALIYFSTIVEKQSFHQAARQLNIPRSTLSRKIAELETQLGVQLLNRTTRKVALTETGQLIFEHCRRLHDEYDFIVRLAQTSTDTPRGRLRVTAPITLGRLLFGAWMVEFNQRYPEISLEIQLSDKYEDLLEHQIDVAIRVGELKNSNLICKHIFTTPRYLFSSGDFCKQHTIDTVDVLSQLPIVALRTEQINPDRITLYRTGHETLTMSINPVIYVNDMLTLVEIVRHGGGIAMIPQFVAQPYIDRGELHRVLTDYQGETASFQLLFQNRQNMPKKMRVFIDFISEVFASESVLLQSR